MILSLFFLIKSLLVDISVFQFGEITNNTAISVLVHVLCFTYIHVFKEYKHEIAGL